ncbi:MAG: YkgJ family cysteine cluster protein [archaeon]
MINRQLYLEESVKEIREFFFGFCVKKCEAECCRIGYTMEVSVDEVKAIFETRDIVKDKRVRKLYNDLYEIKLGPCPAVGRDKEGRYGCRIHSDLGRPKICKDYPIFIERDKVIVAAGCYAVYSGEIDGQLDMLESSGFEVVGRQKRIKLRGIESWSAGYK